MCGIIHLLLACEGKSHVTVGLESRVLAEGALRIKISGELRGFFLFEV